MRLTLPFALGALMAGCEKGDKEVNRYKEQATMQTYAFALQVQRHIDETGAKTKSAEYSKIRQLRAEFIAACLVRSAADVCERRARDVELHPVQASHWEAR